MRQVKKIWKRGYSYWKRMVSGVLCLTLLLSFCFFSLGEKTVKAANTITYNGKVTYMGTTVGSFTVNGQQAFCMEHPVATPPTGTLFHEQIYGDENIKKVLYYGWGGPAQWSGFSSFEQGTVCTSLALSYYYCGTDSMGLMPHGSVAQSMGLSDFFYYLESQGTVPSSSISFSKSSTEAYLTADKEGQRTENIVLNADSRNYIIMKLPDGVTLYNVTKGTNATGTAKINGGDSFYLSAPLSQDGTWKSEKMKGALGKYQPVVMVTDGNIQNLGQGRWAADPEQTVELKVEWLKHGNINLEKQDAEIQKNKAQGGASLEGAVYEVYNTLGAKRATITTDAEGKGVAELLPYDADGYILKEVSASEGYLTDTDRKCVVNASEVYVTSYEQIKRGDLEGVKIGSGTHKRFANVPFEIVSKTTGESHIVVTDKNGQFSTSADVTLHTQATNAGTSHEDGVWFGECEPDNGMGALLYDTYTVTELKCESNEGYTLIPAFEVTVYKDKQVIDLGTLVDESPDIEPEEPVNPGEPEKPSEITIHTTATNKADGSKVIIADGEATVLDTVDVEEIKIGTPYKVIGWEMVKDENAELEVDGSRVENSVEFIANDVNMKIENMFTFDAGNLGGSDLVTFEELYDMTDPDNPVLVGEHKDIKDKDQTVSIKEKTTTGTGISNKHVKTGDSSKYILWAVLAGISVVVGVVAVVRRRKVENSGTE